MSNYDDGVYEMSNSDYHASSAISRSALLQLDKTPYHFWYQYLSGNAESREPTPDMNLGSAFHTMVLEPHLFEDEFFIIKQKNMPAKDTNPYQLILEEAAGRIVLTGSQVEKVQAMANGFRQHEVVSLLLGDSKFEQSIFWTDEETGLQFKSRPDIWSPKMIVDLKTITDASYRSMQYSALEYGYFLQAGMAYEACKSLGKPFDTFVILGCEKAKPYLPAVFMMDNEALQYGIDQFMTLKRKLKECLDANEWPAYEVRDLSVPAFAIKRIETDLGV